MRDRLTEFERDGLIFAIGMLVGILLHIGLASAKDLGQWEQQDPATRQWYSTLMQPDNPAVSCCGEADAYWCDVTKTEVTGQGEPKNYCIITDDRDDAPLGRPHIEVGTEIEIPNNKLKWDRGNPTGHSVVFLSKNLYVFCFVQPGGV